jgi:DNA-binding MarR family transcriptional regulator
VGKVPSVDPPSDPCQIVKIDHEPRCQTLQSEGVVPVETDWMLTPLVRFAEAVAALASGPPARHEAAVLLPQEPPNDGGVPEIVVSLRFHATWAPADCSRSQGSATGTVQGNTLSVSLSPSFFARLCALQPSHEIQDLLLALHAEAARAIGRAIVGVDSSAEAAEISRSLETLASTMDDTRASVPAVGLQAPATQVPSAPAAWGAAASVPSVPESSTPSPESFVVDAAGALDASADAEKGDASQNASLQAMGAAVDEEVELEVDRALLETGSATDQLSGAAGGSTHDAPIKNEPVPSEDFGDAKGSNLHGDPIATPSHAGDTTPSRSVWTWTRVMVDGKQEGVPIVRKIATAAVAVAALIGMALYQRLSKPRALDHPVRQAAYRACVGMEKGGTAQEIAAQVGVSRKAAEYHLVYLVRLGFLQEIRSQEGPRRFATPLAALRPEARASPAERVIACVRANPGIRATQLAKMLAMHRTKADRHVKELLIDGLIESEGLDGVRRLFPGPDASS